MKVFVLKFSTVKNNLKTFFQCCIYFIYLFMLLIVNDKFKKFNLFDILYFKNKRNNGYFN